MRALISLLTPLVISPDNGEISNSNVVASDVTLYHAWELSVDLKLDNNRFADDSNVLALGVNHKYADNEEWQSVKFDGDRVPAVFMNGGANTISVCNSINGEWNHCWESDDLPPGWFNLNVKQRPQINVGLFYPRIMYEIYIDGKWQYSIENEQPKVWRNVNAKIANAVGNASQGVYRDFTLTTMNLQEAVESGMTRLQDHFAQILSNSGLSQKAKNKNVKKFNKETNKLIAFYESLRDDDQHPCTFPSTWESKHEADIDHGDPCMATLLVTLAVEEWGKVFVHQCRREKNGGNPLTLLNRVLKKVEKQRIAVDNKLFSDACEAP